MAYLKLLTVAFLFLFSVCAHAGYAQVAPPAGWSYAGGSATGYFNPAAAANDVKYAANNVRFNAALNVGGKAVVMPASMRFAANAGRIAFGAMRISPLGIGIMGLQWLASECIGQKDGSFVRTCGPAHVEPVPSDGNDYYPTNLPEGVYYPSPAAACVIGLKAWSVASNVTATFVRALDGTCYANWGAPHNLSNAGTTGYASKPAACPTGTYSTPAGCVLTPPPDIISPDEVEEIMAPKPVPDYLPREIEIPLPVARPVINPSPDNPDISIPYVIPIGDPVPTNDPNVWRQPIVRVVPSPLLDNPWRVDLQPDEILQPNSTPRTTEQLNPNSPFLVKPNPDAVGLCDQYPGIAACAPASTPEAKKKFCEENPDLLVCQPNETPDVPDLEKKNVDISINPDSGWGSGGGSCPADRKLSHASFSFQPYCDFASGIRPVLIAIAWLVGGFILIGHKAD